MPKALLAEMDAIAKEVGLSRSDVIAALLHATLPTAPSGTPRACPRGFRRPFDVPKSSAPPHPDQLTLFP